MRVVEEPLLLGDPSDRPVPGAEVAFVPPSFSRLGVTERDLTLAVPKLDVATSDRTVQLSGALGGKSPLGSNIDLSASKLDRLPPSFRVEFPRLVAVTIAAQTDPVDLGPGRKIYRRVGVSRDVLLHR